ncbi:MAG: cytochrome c, class [Edaphobacter sp.]|nr:cytochrome c, class [Edaphobacter sp.]
MVTSVNRLKLIWMAGLLALAATMSLALPGARKPIGQKTLLLREKRASTEDLELSGNLPGLPANAVRFVSHSDLLKLPQVTVTVTDDPNFKGKTEISGVYLAEILRALDIPEKDTLIAAICDDKYEAHYPVQYRAEHHPILVLRINGKQTAQWPRTSDDGSYGPYLVSHASFTPRYRVLAYAEEAQIPNGVLELRFLEEEEVFNAIHPRGDFAAGSPEMLGYQIARENCFRCHNADSYGGHKASMPWSTLGRVAQNNPKIFERYIKNPQAVNSLAQMPGFPEYDDATLSTLTTYFQTFSTEKGSK